MLGSVSGSARADRTADTSGQRYLHNCPSCRCKVSNNLYLSPKQPQPQNMIMTFAPTQQASHSFSRFAMTFPASPHLHNHFVFSYMSPPKRYHSAEYKFNTRKFKNQHFPFLGQTNENQGQLVSYVVRPKGNNREMEETMKTPQKHPRIRREEKKRKSEVGVGVKEGKRVQQGEGVNMSPISQIRDILPTKPILPNKQAIPRQYVRPNKDILAKQQSLQSEQILLKNNNSHSNRQYPTIKSIQVFEPKPNLAHLFTPSSNALASMRSMEQSHHHRDNAAIAKYEQSEMATSLMQQLQLHYDYYYPLLDKSDKSVSLMIQL